MSDKRLVLHCRHSTQSLEYLSATLPNDCAFCANEQIRTLADALAAIVERLDGDRNFINPDGGAEMLVAAEAALRAAGRLK